jgi:glycosyltransferase involved in cell wall biosynthesis
LQDTAIHSAHSSAPSDNSPDLTVAIVVCTRNRPVVLRNCLHAIGQLNPAPNEVIVVDNTNGDKETESLALEFSARYITEPIPGLSRARNRGLTESKSEIVAYLDDDAVPDEHWLEFLLAPFADPNVAVVTGETVPAQSSAAKSKLEPPRFVNKENRQWFEIAAYGGLGIGTNMALRRAACQGWKIFDERLGRGAPFQGMEEHHAFARLLSLSYCAVHVPAAIVVHSSQNIGDVKREARNSIAYWLLLFSEFPACRLNLLRFLFRRLRRKPLTWPRNSPDPGEIITSGWRVLLKAGLAGTLLFMRTRKSKDK